MNTTYVSLLNFTEQGARELRKSVQRAIDWRKEIESEGVKLLAQLWTAGTYDGALILEGEESKVLGSLARLAARGNVRAQSFRAFDAREFASIIDG